MEIEGIVKERYNVILYGIGGLLDRSRDYIDKRFNIIGYSDSDEHKKINLHENEIFYEPDSLNEISFDYIFITSIFDEEIKKSLVEKYNVLSNKIMKLSEWQSLKVLCTYGSENPESTFYILSRFTRHKDGLFSNVFLFLQQLKFVDDNKLIPIVDMMNYRNQYLEENKLTLENSWEYYFEQMSNYTLSEVYQSQNVVLGYDKEVIITDINWEDIKLYRNLWNKYIKVKPSIEKLIKCEYSKIIGKDEKVLGVLCRGTDYNSLKLKNHAIQPTPEELIKLSKMIINEGNFDKIFLATEIEEAIDKFKHEYKDRVTYIFQNRFSQYEKKWLADVKFNRKNDCYLRGLEYLTAIKILSMSKYILGGLCYGSLCAVIMSDLGEKDYEFVIKGVY